MLLAAAWRRSSRRGAAWVREHCPGAGAHPRAPAARDVDGDGLIEGEPRRGRSGHREWATNWWDIISFGWKDAWLNALLFDGLVRPAGCAEVVAASRHSAPRGCVTGPTGSVFCPPAHVPQRGRPAGWGLGLRGRRAPRPRLPVRDGTAVTAGLLDDATGPSGRRPAVEALGAAGFDMFELGLPGNVLPVPDADLAGPCRTCTTASTRTGPPRCRRRATSSGRCRRWAGTTMPIGCSWRCSAVWPTARRSAAAPRAWTGACGTAPAAATKGLLTEQFGVLIPALARWGPRDRHRGPARGGEPRGPGRLAARRGECPPVARGDRSDGHRPAARGVPHRLRHPAARYASGLPGRHVARWLDASGVDGCRRGHRGHRRAGRRAARRPWPVRVAEGGTRFEHEDGTPFLWLADTWWHALSPRITDEELRELAIQRVVLGFTAVQLVVGPLPEVREGEARVPPSVASVGAWMGACDPSTSRRPTGACAPSSRPGWCPWSWVHGATTSTMREWR